MKQQRDLSFWKLWNLSFGFFGVQLAYALQSSQVSRIFSTIGADPHDLSYFWILPPLMGLIVQPIVGSASDRTWTRLGRRLPYLLGGALVAIIVMCLLPNAGSMGLGISSAIIFGLVMLMLLDTSINMAMQPFKMLVGDSVNEKQKGLAYSIQSFLCNAGSVVGYLAPFCLAYFLSNTAPSGEVPQTVTWAFYIGVAILLLCVVYTLVFVREMPPAEYAAFHGIKTDKKVDKKKNGNVFALLRRAPKVFWTVGLVQFFCWAAFMYMWTYTTEVIANQAYDTPVSEKIDGLRIDGKDYTFKNLFAGNTPLVLDGRQVVADGYDFSAAGTLTTANIAILPEDGGEYYLDETETLPALSSASKVEFIEHRILNPASEEYQKAGNNNGTLLAIQGIVAVLWAIALSRFRNRRLAYSLSLLIGAAGFVSVFFSHNMVLLGIGYGLAGCAWASMLAMPFTILTNALSGDNIGTYLGLFNCTICLPQIIASVFGGIILKAMPLTASGVPNSPAMILVSGILLFCGAIAVWNIKETFGSRKESASEVETDMLETRMGTDADI